MNWDRLRVFHAVAKTGSFTKAGRALELSQSAVSRQIGSLEETLGAALFHRHTRGVVLTEQGEDFHATVREMAMKIDMARARLNESRDQPEGPLKITTTVAFGSAWLTSRMKQLSHALPRYSGLVAARGQRRARSASAPGRRRDPVRDAKTAESHRVPSHVHSISSVRLAGVLGQT